MSKICLQWDKEGWFFNKTDRISLTWFLQPQTEKPDRQKLCIYTYLACIYFKKKNNYIICYVTDSASQHYWEQVWGFCWQQEVTHAHKSLDIIKRERCVQFQDVFNPRLEFTTMFSTGIWNYRKQQNCIQQIIDAVFIPSYSQNMLWTIHSSSSGGTFLSDHCDPKVT